MIEKKIATQVQLTEMAGAAKQEVTEAKKRAWAAFQKEIKEEIEEVKVIFADIAAKSKNKSKILAISNALNVALDPARRDVFDAVNEVLMISQHDREVDYSALIQWRREHKMIH